MNETPLPAGQALVYSGYYAAEESAQRLANHTGRPAILFGLGDSHYCYVGDADQERQVRAAGDAETEGHTWWAVTFEPEAEGGWEPHPGLADLAPLLDELAALPSAEEFCPEHEAEEDWSDEDWADWAEADAA